MNDNREKFASRLGFILVSAGCAVGLGNVWKFPYICGKNGGAAFIVIYLLCLLGLGLPILICEYAIGRGSNKSLGSAFKALSPEGTRWHHFRWVAYAGNYLLMMFYTMVAGWMLNYFAYSLSGKLTDKSVDEIGVEFSQMLASPGIMTFWTFVVVLVSIGVCSLGLQKGVEKISKVMMILLLALMVVMAVNSVMLEGSAEGLKFYLVPDFNKMKEQGIGNVVFAAMSHAFFTLGLGIGSMEIFGSYLSKDCKLTGESINVVILDTVVALTAGIIIIPACFAYGINPGAGPSLLFITLPNVFNQMPGGQLWEVLFFVFMAFAALSTVIAVYENIIAMTMDLFGCSRKRASIVNLFVIAALSMPAILGYNVLSGIEPIGAGTTLMDLEDFIVSYNILPLGCLLFVLFCTRKNGWGYDNFVAEVNEGKGLAFPKWMKPYMMYILPVIDLVIYFKGYYDMFKPQGTKMVCIWMTIAVVLALLVFWIAAGHGSKDKSEK